MMTLKLVLRRFLTFVMLGIFCFTACVSPELRPTTPATSESISQWAVAARASSHYAYPDWAANRATGAPEIMECADDPRAWASARGNGVEWLELTYAQPVRVTEIRIHQSYGRGAISKVGLINESGTLEVVWESSDAIEPCPGLLIVPVLVTSYAARVVRVELDESRTATWNQIDAVELIGER